MKKVLSLAIAAALVAPVAAMADATVYGKLHVAYDFLSDNARDIDVAEMNSHDSRLGIKGSEDLGNGLKAVYKMEFGVDVVETSSIDWKGRNMYVGLAGDFGTALAGRHDTPLKMSQGKFDQFGDTVADIKSVMPGEDRLGNVLAYVSPNLSGFTAVAAIVSGENGDGGTDELNGIADHYSLAGMYTNGPIYGALAYNSYDLGGYDANPSLWRGTVVFTMDMFQVGAMYSNFAYDINNVDDSSAWGLSGAFNVGKGKIKAQYMVGDNPMTKINSMIAFDPNVTLPVPGDNETTQWTIGYEHGLSKRTSVYALYTEYQEDQKTVDSNDDGVADAEEDSSSFSLGIIHKF